LDRAMQGANFRELHFWNCLKNPKHEPNVKPRGESSRRKSLDRTEGQGQDQDPP
jgi:hypothetical protein